MKTNPSPYVFMAIATIMWFFSAPAVATPPNGELQLLHFLGVSDLNWSYKRPHGLNSMKVFDPIVPDYVFMPTNAGGEYTNPANWLNGNYPGTTIPKNKTVAFRKNGNYKFAQIDNTINILGNLVIEDSMHVYVPKNKSILFGQQFSGVFSPGQLQSAYSSMVTIDGEIIGYGTALQFGHGVIVNGRLSFSPSDGGFDFIKSYISCDSAITITGTLSGQVVAITSKIIQLSKSGKLMATNGYDFNMNSVVVSTLMNDGTINLNECSIRANYILNSGSLLAHFLQLDSLLVNSGSFTITPFHHWAGQQIISMRGSFQNYGTFSASANSPVNILLDNDIINAGFMNISTGGSGNAGPLNFKRSVVNANEIVMLGADARFEGSLINDSLIYVRGQIEFINANCINNGTLSFFMTKPGGANKILSNFLNTGTLSNYGALQLGEKFINAGKLNVVPN